MNKENCALKLVDEIILYLRLLPKYFTYSAYDLKKGRGDDDDNDKSSDNRSNNHR